MPKTDRVGFHFDNSKEPKKHKTKLHQIIEQKWFSDSTPIKNEVIGKTTYPVNQEQQNL